MAVGFQSGHYIDNLNEIIRLRGTADGDCIVDKHSGYMITKLQYDENEGYEKSGFKRVSRAILETWISSKESPLQKKYYL